MKKHCVEKVLLEIWEAVLHENDRNYKSNKFSYKFAFMLLFSFLTNQKQKPGFQQVGGLVTRNICFLLMASRTLLQSHTGIFLHVISVCIIVSWFTKKAVCFKFSAILCTYQHETISYDETTKACCDIFIKRCVLFGCILISRAMLHCKKVHQKI